MAVFRKLQSRLSKLGSIGALAAGAAWLTLSTGVFGQRITSEDVRPDFFPFSVWYSGGKARAPMLEPIDEGSRERWKQDLLQIRRLGFNTVRTWVEWTANEPRPGKYDFSNLRLLAELAQEVGLKFFVQVYTDSAPDWVGAEWEDARFVAQNGAAIPSQSAPGYCFDHPEVRRRILDFYQAAARVASSYPNFAGWDLWSEPHVINWAIIDYIPNASFCYCPSSMRRFREWLKSKYGSLEVLNRRWYRTFTNWNQVEPPRFGTILSYTDFIDWKLYIRDKLAEDLGLRAQAVRDVDAGHLVTSHAAVPGLFTSPLWGVGAPDDWLMAAQVDYFGTSIYPKHSFPERHWGLLTLTSLMDFIRSSGRQHSGFYVGELQAGMGIRGTVVGNPITQDDQRLWVMGMLSRGARAINVYAYYPMSSGYEAGGYGLVELDGKTNPRAKAMGQLARMVGRHQDLLLHATPEKADVAVIYNPLAYLVGGEQHLSEAGAVREALQGVYRALWKQNIPCDFVHLSEVESGELGHYKVAFLTYPLMLTRKVAERLRGFVEDGGVLYAEARCGWNDERGYAQEIIPGFGLNEVFGVREGRLKMEKEVILKLISDSMEGLSGRLVTPIVGTGIREELLPAEGTEVLGRFEDGSPALTVRRFGRGKAYMAGSFLSIANGQSDRESNDRVFQAIARDAGAEPVLGIDLPVTDPPCEIRLLRAGDASLIYLFNHSTEKVSVPLPFGHLTDLERDQPLSGGNVVLQPGEIRALLGR